MSYTLHGQLGGKEVSVTWDNGQLSGKAAIVTFLMIQAEVMEGRAVGGPTGPWTYTNHLASGLSTIFLFRELCDEPITADGDVPEPPPIPPGAVA
jgi:hypothetical protein